MQLFVLLKDDKNSTYNRFEMRFDKTTTLRKLRENIMSVFSIEVIFQRLFYSDERELSSIKDDSLLVRIGLSDMDTVITRHSKAANWGEFVVNYELAVKALNEKRIAEVKRNVDLALDHLKPLKESNFLVTFTSYNELYRSFMETFSQYMDQEFKYIAMATKDYFSKLFMDSPENPNVDNSLICRVRKNEIPIGKYYVREHVKLGGKHADLRVLFLYKLLEIIKVGFPVHFIPSVHFSSFGLYIGSEEAIGFKRADTEGLEINNECHVQRDLLRRLLFIKALNSRNFGIDGNGNLSVVDFQVKNVVDPDMAKKFLYGFGTGKEDRDLRIRVASDSIKSWDLPNTFDLANAAISTQKDLFKKYCISYKASHDFDMYFSKIKANLQTLIELLEGEKREKKEKEKKEEEKKDGNRKSEDRKDNEKKDYRNNFN